MKIEITLDPAPLALDGCGGKEPSSSCATPIPKRIWSYWEGPPSRTVDACVRSWRSHNPEYEITILTKSTLGDYMDMNILPRHASDSIARFTDYVRLEILARNGGIWIDASIIVNAPFDWIHAAAEAAGGADMVGFYIHKFTNEPIQRSPVIESWFFACTQGSPFVTQWRDEFFSTARFDTIDDYVRHKENVDGVDAQKIDAKSYLCIHVSAQACLQRQYRRAPMEAEAEGNPSGKICLYRAEDGPFRYLCDHQWNCYEAVKGMLGNYDDRYRSFPIIKLRGCERNVMDRSEFDADVVRLLG